MDELRDRPALRAVQRGHHLHRRPARRRTALAGDARASSSATWSASPPGSSAPRGWRRAACSVASACRSSWPGLGGMGAVAGIGFTVSLLISSLAFRGQLLEEAKMGILAGAVLSALSAWGGLPPHRADPGLDARTPAQRHRRPAARPRRRRRPRARPSSRPPRRARDPARVRRLRVPVLRTGRDRRPRAARLLRRRPLLRLAPPPAQRRPPARPDGGRGGRGGGRPGQVLGHARHAAQPPGRAAADAPPPLRGGDGPRPRALRGRRAPPRPRAPRRTRRRRAPTRAGCRGRRPSSSTAGATRAPTTSRRSPPRCARRAAR